MAIANIPNRMSRRMKTGSQEVATSFSQLLKQCVLFQTLDDSQLERVAGLARKEKYLAGKVIFEKDDKLQDLYVIERGSVRLTMDVRLWSSSATLRPEVMLLAEGDAFGWSSLVEPRLATLAAHSREPSSVIALNAGDLSNLLDADPVMGYRVMQGLASLLAGRLLAIQASIALQRAHEILRLPSCRVG